jgi:hypothetical protein
MTHLDQNPDLPVEGSEYREIRPGQKSEGLRSTRHSRERPGAPANVG